MRPPLTASGTPESPRTRAKGFPTALAGGIPDRPRVDLHIPRPEQVQPTVVVWVTTAGCQKPHDNTAPGSPPTPPDPAGPTTGNWKSIVRDVDLRGRCRPNSFGARWPRKHPRPGTASVERRLLRVDLQASRRRSLRSSKCGGGVDSWGGQDIGQGDGDLRRSARIAQKELLTAPCY